MTWCHRSRSKFLMSVISSTFDYLWQNHPEASSKTLEQLHTMEGPSRNHKHFNNRRVCSPAQLTEDKLVRNELGHFFIQTDTSVSQRYIYPYYVLRLRFRAALTFLVELSRKPPRNVTQIHYEDCENIVATWSKTKVFQFPNACCRRNEGQGNTKATSHIRLRFIIKSSQTYKRRYQSSKEIAKSTATSTMRNCEVGESIHESVTETRSVTDASSFALAQAAIHKRHAVSCIHGSCMTTSV